jgi:lysozyme
MDLNRALKVTALGILAWAVYEATQGNYLSPIQDTTDAAANNVSADGIALIQSQEGFSAKAYPDGNGYSIGYGHQIIPGDGLTPQSVITQAQALQLLNSDIAKVVAAINANVKVPLTQNQYDALADFTYNEGVGALQSSTLLQLLNSGDYIGASGQFELWTIANGAHNAVLAARRGIEQTLFNT